MVRSASQLDGYETPEGLKAIILYSKELESLAANDVYTEQTECGQKCLSARWICTLKETPEGRLYNTILFQRK